MTYCTANVISPTENASGICSNSKLAEKGKIEGAVHIPRGVLEFYIDPVSGMHNEIFSSDKKVVFYCASGGRSVLAAKLAMDMGVKNAAHLEGGFAAWENAGGATEPRFTQD